MDNSDSLLDFEITRGLYHNEMLYGIQTGVRRAGAHIGICENGVAGDAR